MPDWQSNVSFTSQIERQRALAPPVVQLFAAGVILHIRESVDDSVPSQNDLPFDLGLSTLVGVHRSPGVFNESAQRFL